LGGVCERNFSKTDSVGGAERFERRASAFSLLVEREEEFGEDVDGAKDARRYDIDGHRLLNLETSHRADDPLDTAR